MSTALQRPTMADRLEGSLNKATAGSIELSAKNGMVIKSMEQAMEFAKLMSLAGEAVPKHLREKPGACLAIAVQAYEWQMNPFALANKSYVVNDRLCYEAQMYQSVVARRAPIVGRVKMEYTGDAANRTCRVYADLSDGTGTVEYVSPKFSTIKPKNSPLWVNDPDQQLFYFSVRAFARRHFPDVMMGIYTVDEMIDEAVEVVNAIDIRPKADRLADRLLQTTAVPSKNAEPASDTPSAEVKHAANQSTSADHDERFAVAIEIATTVEQLDSLETEINHAWNKGDCEGPDLLHILGQRRTELER